MKSGPDTSGLSDAVMHFRGGVVAAAELDAQVLGLFYLLDWHAILEM